MFCSSPGFFRLVFFWGFKLEFLNVILATETPDGRPPKPMGGSLFADD
jgi:hypothetical protein